MAPSRVAATQWARQTFARRNNRVSRIAPTSCQRISLAQSKKDSHELRFNSLLPTGGSSPSESAQGSRRCSHSGSAGSNEKILPLNDLNCPSLLLPGIDDTNVNTPPPWKSPYVIELKTPKADGSNEVYVIESPCASPTKTPGRVAKVFSQLLPVTPRAPRRTDERKRSKKSIVSGGLRMIARVSTAIGFKTPKTQFLSLADLRRHLLQQHRSLHKAFKAMETHLQEIKHKEGTSWMKSTNVDMHASMELAEFTKAIAFFDIDHFQARHFFELMDANCDGLITIEEFKGALVRMPREVLLQDFRKRLMKRYSSTYEAFKELSMPPGHRDRFTEGESSKPLNREAFAFHLSRLGVDEQESSFLFDIIDVDVSGTISMDELRETLREVAPPVSLEDFWHRFAARWPNIRAAASGRDGRKGATEQLFKIFPPKYRGTSLDPPLTISADAWDIICAHLDVSRPNAEKLFRLCATAKVWQGHTKVSDADGTLGNAQIECDVDDFFDELQLWSQTPLARHGAGMRQSYGRDLAQHFSSIKAQLVTA
eukprot:gnl/MRDRNA2_/MRDRNA2_100786_c0_seq1.p1 gnl/MRDRNA2_/MRDRNA2_100786_c0~~gnl/MRDRNA2_/MRDRNA2_100786_c0_seq1.p1  ORF type:complete len:540 (+),score=82.78 gnl/MRDRNA2_/MRDRNA2_100786_c0_seq1:106-1725(+)